MMKVDTIRLLNAERCSVMEIADYLALHERDVLEVLEEPAVAPKPKRRGPRKRAEGKEKILWRARDYALSVEMTMFAAEMESGSRCFDCGEKILTSPAPGYGRCCNNCALTA